MSKDKKNLKRKVEELQRELEWLEAKFYRSGVDITVRLKTLLRMQKLTQGFLMWLAGRESEGVEERAKEAEQIE